MSKARKQLSGISVIRHILSVVLLCQIAGDCTQQPSFSYKSFQALDWCILDDHGSICADVTAAILKKLHF